MQRRFFVFSSLLIIGATTQITCIGEVGTQGPAGPVATDGDCPSDYERDMSETRFFLCRNGVDEVVKVGTKWSAFWVDRYEASIWDDAGGAGNQLGINAADYPAMTFPQNGQTKKRLFALSVKGVMPSRFLTWFQANEACRASGKRLMNGDEWFAAARGTKDVGPSPGGGGSCVTASNGPRLTGGGSTNCVSDWGAEDMVGNLAEWTAEWHAGVGDSTQRSSWPKTAAADYGNDLIANVASSVVMPDGTPPQRLPSATTRGGFWGHQEGAGIFDITLDASPTYFHEEIGFRCIIPR